MKSKELKIRNALMTSVSFLILSLFMVSCANQPAAPSAEEAHDAIWKKITRANDLWADGNTLGFVECAAEDVTWMDDLAAPKPVIGKAALKTYLESFMGMVPKHEHKLMNSYFQYYDDIVIVTYWYQGIFEGEPQTPWKVTSVYRYADGDWLSVHENWTEVNPASQE